jgi:HPt (histidine-containing phosphotransfer) domain-containing protein
MTDPAAKIASRIEEIWRASRPSILERVAALQAAHRSLAADPEDAAARDGGREAAHKLSGILGVFGLPRGSELASEIEACLKSPEALTPEVRATLGTLIHELDQVVASKSAS